jgi:hypothetical protein
MVDLGQARALDFGQAEVVNLVLRVNKLAERGR